MNKQRKTLITTTYNEMGIIIDTKVEEVTQTNLQPACNQLATDTISRRAVITEIDNCGCDGEDSCGQPWIYKENAVEAIEMVEPLPPAQPAIVPCDYAKACNEVSMNRITSAVVYMEVLEDFREYGYVLVDMREVRK